MASLIPTSSKTDFTTALNNHFDTFKETITVYKEPRKVISNTINRRSTGAPTRDPPKLV